MKGVSPLLGLILVIFTLTAAITLVLSVIVPAVKRIRDSNVINEALENLELIDSTLEEISRESKFAKRVITLSVKDGVYKIDPEAELIYFEYEPQSDIILEGKFGEIYIDRSVVYYEFFNRYKDNDIPNGWNCFGNCKIESNKFSVEGFAYNSLNKKVGNFYLEGEIGNVSGKPEIFVTPVNPENLVLYLTFDEGSGNITYDYSGYGNNGSLYDYNTTNADGDTPPVWVDGKFEKALEFDGIDSYVDIGDVGKEDTLTLMAWIAPEGTDSNIIGNNNLATNKGYHWGIYWETDQLRFWIGNGTISISHLSTTSLEITTPPKWYFVAVTFERPVLRFYLNGELDGEYTDVDLTPSYDMPTWIGALARAGGVMWFDGIIDEVKIYNKSLSEEEIKAEYELGIKKLTSSGKTDTIGALTNVSIIVSNPTGKTYVKNIKVKSTGREIKLTIPQKIDLVNELRISKGEHKLVIEHKGLNSTSEKPMVELTLS